MLCKVLCGFLQRANVLLHRDAVADAWRETAHLAARARKQAHGPPDRSGTVAAQATQTAGPAKWAAMSSASSTCPEVQIGGGPVRGLRGSGAQIAAKP